MVPATFQIRTEKMYLLHCSVAGTFFFSNLKVEKKIMPATVRSVALSFLAKLPGKVYINIHIYVHMYIDCAK